LSELFGLSPRIPEHIDVAHLRALGFVTVVLHKNRTIEFLREKSEMLKEGDYYQRKEFTPSEGMALFILEAISKQLEEQVGQPHFEDDNVRIFRLR